MSSTRILLLASEPTTQRRVQLLLDAVYKRRGWTKDGIPTLAHVRKLGIDKVPGVVELLAQHGVTE